MNLIEIALGAGALYVTDMMLTPMFAGSEFGVFLKLALQAWILKVLYNGYLGSISSGSQ